LAVTSRGRTTVKVRDYPIETERTHRSAEETVDSCAIGKRVNHYKSVE